jgi:hypothetical protein
MHGTRADDRSALGWRGGTTVEKIRYEPKPHPMKKYEHAR